MNYNFKVKDVEVFMRPFTADDMEDKAYQGAFHDPDVTRYNSHGLFPYTKTKREAFARELEDSTSRIVWAICVQENVGGWQMKMLFNQDGKAEFKTEPQKLGTREKVIGNCALQSINWVNRSAEFAIVIWDKRFWGKGIATNALKVCIHHAFNRLGLNRVWSGTAATNQSMQVAFEKAGMKAQGTFRQGMFLDGMFVDVICCSILANEA